MKKPLCGLLSICSICAASSARASTFDSRGELVFDPNALYTQSFERGAAPAGGSVIAGDPTSINGTHLLRIPAGDEATMSIPLPAKNEAVSFSAYVRGGGVLLQVNATFSGPGVPYGGGFLFPTGQVTSDGWLEMKSSPLSLPASRPTTVTLTLINVSGQNADIDGIEVSSQGSFREARPCSPPDASTCAPGDFCTIGYCTDGSTWVPPLPQGADRADFPAWIGTGLYGNFGGIASRPAGLPAALAALDAMPSAPNATAYWSGLAAAIQLLHDSHSIPDIGFQPSDLLPICFVQGDADLSHAQAPSDPVYPDVLVSHGIAGQMAGLVPGDRLVAVNGMHPIAFARSLVGLRLGNTQSTDPTEYEWNVDVLSEDIRLWATTITVIHCDAATQRCSAPYVLPVASLPTVPFADSPECDNRPAYHLASGNPPSATHETNNDVYFGPLAGVAHDEALYGMIFDGLSPNPGPDPWQAPLASIRAEASGVVIDARVGYGGSFTYASEISGPFLSSNTLTVTWSPEPYFANPAWTRADGLAEFNLIEPVNPFTVGSSTPKPGLKVATLVSYDVSADDFFAYGMRGGVNGAANVRSFGTKSAGAFGQIVTESYAAGAVWLGFGNCDSFTPTGAALDGTGAEPDEHVVPLQSDLLAGRDTAYERALAWLRCTSCDAHTETQGGNP